jgi:hypothetical protein
MASPIKELIINGGDTHIFRARGARLYSCLGYFMCLGLGSTTFLDTSFTALENTSFAIFVVFCASVIYLGIQRPRIVFTDIGVGVQNPFSSTVVDWQDVNEIKTKFTLILNTNYGLIRCWAAVGPSRSQHRAIHPSDLRGTLRHLKEIKASNSPRVDSGVAALIALQRMNRRKQVARSSLSYASRKHYAMAIGFATIAVSTLFSNFHF